MSHVQANGDSLYKEHFFGKLEDGVEEVHGLSAPLHHHVGINLCGVDAGMPKKFARRIDVCPGCQGHCGKGLRLQYSY